MDDAPTLSLVIPAFNEELRLPETLRILAKFVAGKAAEVVLVVEKSTDRTLQIAQDFAVGNGQFRVLENAVQRGKGYAVKRGMLEAKGSLIFFMDADLSVPVETVAIFCEAFQARPEIDILVGNRQNPASDIMAAQGWLRRSMGQTFNRLVRAISGIPLRDTQCGFKAFRRVVARRLFQEQTIDGFAFDVEILLLARKNGFQMADLPVAWRNSTASKVHILHDSLRMLRDVWRLGRKVES